MIQKHKLSQLIKPNFPSPENNFLIMGIINVTPNSFSDGGSFLNPKKALHHCFKLIEDGADILDIGAESTKPNAAFTSEEEEWSRLYPLLKKLSKEHLGQTKISVDTRRPSIMKKAIDLGVHYINHIVTSPLDSFTIQLLKDTNTAYIATHISNTPKDMQSTPLKKKEALSNVQAFFSNYHAALTRQGLSPQNIFFDPGIGFGKTDSANLHLMQQTTQFAQQYNIAIGISRKSWIGRLLHIENPKKRDTASKLMELGLFFLGAKMVRTHEVKRLFYIKKTLLSDQ